MKKRKRFIAIFLIVFVVSLGIFLLGTKIDSHRLSQFIAGARARAPVTYILLLIMTYVFAPLSGTPFFLAGFLLFRKEFNYYVYLAHIISAVINFWIARIWGRSLVIKLVGKKDMKRVDQLAKHYGLKSLLFLRITLLLFHDFISYASGLTKIKFWPYFLISALGYLPWFLLWQFYLSKVVSDFQDLTLMFAISLVPLWLVAIYLMKRFRKKKSNSVN